MRGIKSGDFLNINFHNCNFLMDFQNRLYIQLKVSSFPLQRLVPSVSACCKHAHYKLWINFLPARVTARSPYLCIALLSIFGINLHHKHIPLYQGILRVWSVLVWYHTMQSPRKGEATIKIDIIHLNINDFNKIYFESVIWLTTSDYFK